MLRKSLATLVAVLLALGLALVATSPASAASDGRPGGGWGSRHGGASSNQPSAPPSTPPASSQQSTAPSPSSAPAPAPNSAPAPAPSASTTPPATSSRSTSSATGTTQTSPTRYGVALYVYKKLDPNKGASWQNSGPQRLVVQDVDNTSKDANVWFTSLDPGLLPADVCGPGWAVQQDKATMSATFTAFPGTISPPVDNIGWPPLYDAKHENLEKYLTVPACPPATAALTFTAASCSAPATVALGAIAHASWGTLTRASGPGNYAVTATADPGYTFAGGGTVANFAGTLDGVLPASDPRCAPPADCIATSAVSYTYDPATNSGVITVPNPRGSSGELCAPFWVTATSWKYLGTSTWIQKLDVVQKLGRISTPGEYAYQAAVTCGQGDIYASFDGNDATLDPTAYLLGPDDPFDEHFLHEMGFTGPKPTYTTSKLGCNQLTVEPHTSDPSCSAEGSYTLSTTPHVTWYVGGVRTEPGTYPAEAGSTVEITAVADETWTLAGGTQDPQSHLWSRSWSYSYGTPSCTLVTPTVTPVQETCSTPGTASYTLPSIEGVVWRVSAGSTARVAGDVVPAGTYTVSTPATVEVTAELADPQGQLAFAPGAQTSWTLAFTAVDRSTCEPPTLGFFPTAATLVETCSATGNTGQLTLGLVDGVSFFEDVNYAVDGTPAASATMTLAPGTHTVTASKKHETDGLDGPTRWTFVVADRTCEPPTLGLFPTNAQLAQQCTSDGRGVLTLGLVDGVSFFDDVNYFIDGVPATSSTVRLSAGSYDVTVTTKNASDGLDGPTAWRVVVTGAAVCGDLETLALTGFDGGYLVAFAAMLLAAGAAILATGRTRQRRAE
ncbi:MAG: hypothetical protein J0H23_06340 [Micrococcales bacterium]|nr:hypothetical protein [Micrococcales bacterium]